VTVRPVPARHWRSYGDDPLPTGQQALDEPFRAFPSWFMRVTCDRCGKDRMLSETHAAQSNMLIRDILIAHAPRRLRRPARTRRVAHRHRGRQQPPGSQDRAARVTRRPRRIYGGDLPTPRTTLRTGYVRVLVFCNSCRHKADADLQAIVESGRGDVPLTELRFRCSQCGTDRTDFVVNSRDNPQPW
jgi:hypothetical protein